MKNVIAAAGIVGLASLAFQTADAAVLTGALSKTADTCPAAIGAINADDCSYNDTFDQGGVGGTDPWVGPDRSSGFYSSSLAVNNPTTDWTREPSPGDGKVHPGVTVNLTINGSNQVSGTIVIGAVAFNNFSSGPGGRGEDSWTSATITLTPKVADSVVGNTLVIGSAGFPPYIQAANGIDHFPSETAADSNASPTPDTLWWATPAPSIGITNVEGNTGTTGTMGVADFVGWTCNDVNGNPADGACASASSFRGRGNFENILLKITTDGAGNALSVEGFLVQGGAGAPNPATTPNWVAWTFSAGPDSDNDGAPDITDNCTLVSNTATGNVPGTTISQDQLDVNGDGYGNICDADLNNDGHVTAAGDYVRMRSVLGQPSTFSALAAAADMNGDGFVTAAGDYVRLRARLVTDLVGPSGYHP